MNSQKKILTELREYKQPIASPVSKFGNSGKRLNIHRLLYLIEFLTYFYETEIVYLALNALRVEEKSTKYVKAIYGKQLVIYTP